MKAVGSQHSPANLGLRYDYAKLSPKALNAACSKACLAEGEPSQSSFSNWSGFLGLGIQPTDTWKFGYQLSTGYQFLLLLNYISALLMLMVHGNLIQD